MLLHQMAAPNSPQWFNTGLNHAYGITGPAQGFWYVDPDTEELTASPDSYTRPAPHACFIQAVDDDLVNEGGIMDLWVREARLFKFGSGTGSNFSHIRAEGESLSGGGKSSGLMSFLKVGDRAAGAIKSGGTTRRAAKMVILDVDHPDIETFVNWKANEEDKVRALVAAGYDSDFNGEAYATVSGQNSNNSVRLSNEFIQAVLDDADWDLTARTDGRVMKTVKARDLWRQVAEAAWKCADPGVQFDTTIQEWHTSPAGGRIRATNPCFTGDTRIATDKGLIPIGDIVRRAGEGESFEVYSHDATHADAPTETVRLSSPTQYMVTGTSEIVKLELSDGRTLRCTPNHRLFTYNRGWVRADELADDDRIRLLDREVDFGMASWALPVPTEAQGYVAWSSRTYPVRLPEKWSEDLAHYLGWLVGDGSVSEKTAVTVYGTEYEQQSIMVQHAELLTELNGGVNSEYVFLDNTACNLASLNLVAFERADGTFDLDAYRHAIRLWTIVLEISVTMAHFPSAEIAQGSYDYRTLGLGYANLGSLLMRDRHRLRLRRGAGHRRCADRRAHRVRLCHVGGDGRGARAVPQVHREPRRHVAGDAQPPAGRLRRRPGRVRRGVPPRGRDRPGAVPARHARGGAHRLGPGGGARRGPRLPQRPVHGARSDRDHRAVDGL